MNKQTIDINRFLADFAELKQIGATPEGGVNRPAFSAAHLEARAWFRQKAEAAGLSIQVDPAGNHSAVLKCSKPGAPTLLIGSHLDSVYQGGAYDGALGVLSGLEALRTIKEMGKNLPFDLEVIDFSDEEGTLIGMLGSKALTGHFSEDMLAHGIAPQEKINEALDRGGLQPNQIAAARRDPNSILGYFELHIEQGPQLYNENVQIGVVTGIVGMRVLRVVFKGKANHAGTTAMDARQDAGLGASALNLSLRQRVLEDFPDCVATVGQMQFKPGGVNIVPEEAVLSIDFRSVNAGHLDRLENEINNLAKQQADAFGLAFSIERTLQHEPALMHPDYQDSIEAAADGLQLSHIRMPSGAGHDAQNMAAICPCGMIFVPSREGVSHSPFEFTSDADCVNGANTVLQSVLHLAGA